MIKNKYLSLLLLLASAIMISCSKDGPTKDSGKSGVFKMVITISEPIDASKSAVSFTFVGIKDGLSVKSAANYSSPDDDNCSIDEDTLSVYGSPITVKTVAPVDYNTVTVGFGGIQEPAPLKLHLDIFYDEKKIDEKDLTLSNEMKAIIYNFKADGESTTYQTDYN